MGGLNSGRPRHYACIDECIALDLAMLKKKKMLAPGGYRIEETRWIETNFVERKEYSYQFHIEVASDHLILDYAAGASQQDYYHHNHTISLTSTTCNYGGARLWFIAPCCGQRVRVLYLNLKQADLERIAPQCRHCLDLHYSSQLSSYIERHKTYEGYLLANYGYLWAAHRYEYELKYHYLKVTPALEELRQRSILERTLHYIKLLLSTQHMLLQTELAHLRYDQKQTKRNADLSLVKNLREGIEFERSTRSTNLGGAGLDMLLATVETLEDEPDILEEDALKMKIIRVEQAQKTVEKELKSLKMVA